MPDHDPKASEETGYFDAYAGFARTLRTWLIAYGIGGPVLFLSNEKVWGLLRSSGYLRWIAGFFLGGVVIQVVGAIIYKSAMWHLYTHAAESDSSKKRKIQETKSYQISSWLSECYWLEVAFDASSFLLFFIATLLGFVVLT